MTVLLNFAGCCHPDPGAGAYGAVVAGLVATPYRLRGIVPVRDTTVGVAAWWGLREGLETVVYHADRGGDLRGDDLVIRGDSGFVTDALTAGVPAVVPAEQTPLLAECRALLGRVATAGCRWRAEHVTADQNAHAVALCREAWGAVTGKPFPNGAH